MRKSFTKQQEHLKCQVYTNLQQYKYCKYLGSHPYSTSWTSNQYTLSITPFFTCRDISFKRIDINDKSKNAIIKNNYTSTRITKLQELKTYISICHLKKQPMLSLFKEFQFMVHKTKSKSG